MDLKTLDNNLEVILNRTSELISKSEAEDLKFLAMKHGKNGEFEMALECDVRAAKIFENLFYRDNFKGYLYGAATCYDHSGKYAAYIASKAKDKYFKKVFTKYGIKFKELAGRNFIKRVFLGTNNKNEKKLALIAANCFEWAGRNSSLYLQDFENAARLKRRAACFFYIVGNYDDAIWKYGRAVEDMGLLEKIPKIRIRVLISKIERLIEKRGTPKNFKLDRLKEKVERALG